MPFLKNMTVDELLSFYHRNPNSIDVLREMAYRLKDLNEERTTLRELLSRIEEKMSD